MGPTRQPAHSVSSSAEGYEFYEELLPISLLVTRRTLTATDVPGVFEYYRWLCRRQLRFVAVSDVRASQAMPDAKTRRRFAEESARFASDAAKWSLGAIVIVDSPLIRGAMTAIEWLYRPARPTRYFTDFHEALTCAVELLDAGGVALSPSLRHWCSPRLEESRVPGGPARAHPRARALGAAPPEARSPAALQSAPTFRSGTRSDPIRKA